MKKIMVILAFAAALALLNGCGEEKVVEFSSLQQRGGVYVVPETQKPYSGKFVVTNGNTVRKAGSLKNGKLHGETTTYREDGSIEEIETFADGVLNGKMLYKNGKLERVEHYKDGELDGKCEYYHENGKLLSVGHYKDGKADGKMENYHENGKLESIWHFKDGKEDGKWESYYENGKLLSVEHYKDGEPDGKWENYYENGKLRNVVHYKDGKREFYDENGKQILGSFSDQRDGKSYATVKIGTQTWMAENLNYDVASDPKCDIKRTGTEKLRKKQSAGGSPNRGDNLNCNTSTCWGDDPANCKKYGRLYNWNTAMKVCPSGWHLPSGDEWQELIDIAGGDKVAGTALKAASGWRHNGNGTDRFGFSALPGGIDGIGVGTGGGWWSANESRTIGTGSWDDVGYLGEGAHWFNGISIRILLSVRCIQGELSELDKAVDSHENDKNFAKDIDKVLKNVAGLQTTGKTELGGRRGSATGGINDGYAEGGSGGIGDMLGGLNGGSAGGIGTRPKGGQIKLSNRDIDMGSGDAARSKAEIMAVVNARMPGLRNIYNKYLKLKPSFSGKVTIKFTIAPGGDIVSISILSSTTGYSEFDNAVKNIVGTWKWKAIKSGNTTPTIPFSFTE